MTRDSSDRSVWAGIIQFFLLKPWGFCWIGLVFFVVCKAPKMTFGKSFWETLSWLLQVRVHDSAWEHATHPDWSNQTIYLQQIIIHDYQMKKKIILSTYFYILYHVKNALSDPKKPRKKKPFCHARSQQRTVAKSNETGAIGKVYLLLCWESHPEAR